MFLKLEGFGESPFVCFTGGGGKTTLMLRLSRCFLERGSPVFVTTTTRMGLEEIRTDVESSEVRTGFFFGSEPALESAEGKKRLFLFRRVEEGHYCGFSPRFVEDLRRRYPERALLVEADGSRRKPLKGYAEYEPPLPESFDLQIIVVGVDALVRPLSDLTVARWEIVRRFLDVSEGTTPTPQYIAKLLNSPGMYLKNSPRATKRLLCLNKADLAEASVLKKWLNQLPPLLKGYCGIMAVGEHGNKIFYEKILTEMEKIKCIF